MRAKTYVISAGMNIITVANMAFKQTQALHN